MLATEPLSERVQAALAGQLPLAETLPLLILERVVERDWMLNAVAADAWRELNTAARALEQRFDDLDDLFGDDVGKILHACLDEVLQVEDFPMAVCRVVREAFQTTRPTGTAVGLVLSWCAERYFRNRRGLTVFYRDEPDLNTIPALAQAGRIWVRLPHMVELLELLMWSSSDALKQRVEATGRTHVRLFRGVTPPSGQPEGWRLGRREMSGPRYPLRALSSWSAHRDSAAWFAGEHGVVVEADVPASCLALAPGYAEEEVVIFPLATDVKGRTRRFHELRIRRVARP